MQRLRVTLITAGLVTALAALTLSSLAQQPPGPNGGPGRGGRGGPGFGGFGGPGFGGFGGPGGSLLGLAQNAAVQEELKLKEAQKAKIKSLADELNQRMRDLRNQMGPGPGQGGRRGRNRNANPNAANAGPNGLFGGQNPALGGVGANANPFAPGGGGFVAGQNLNPANGIGNPNGPGPGGRGQMDPARAQQFAMMREAMAELNQGAEQTLARILERGQYNRLRQIQLQNEGPSALLRPDVIEKLNMDEAQVQQLQELMAERRQAQRGTRMARGALMKSAFPQNANPNPGNNGPNGGNRFNNPAFREAMKKFWESPETKAKMEEFRSQDEKIDQQFLAAANRVLSRRQSAAFKKMLGAPFDLSKLRGGGPPWARNANTNRAGTSPTGSGGEAAAGATNPSSTKSGTTGNPSTARPKRKSLRELRGIPEKPN